MTWRFSSISNYVITNRCNSRCTICNIWKTDPTADPKIDQISNFFEVNKDYLKNLRFIQLTGGEPFLRSDLPEIAEIIHDISPNCMIWIPTNGLLPQIILNTTQKVLTKIDETKLGITISIDGTEKIHDKQRGIIGSYKKALETLNLLSSLKKMYKFHLSTGFTLTDLNYNQSHKVQEIAYKHNSDFSVRPINLSEHYYRNLEKDKAFSNNTVTHYLDIIAKNIIKRKGIIRSLTNLAYIQGSKDFINNQRKMTCSAVTESIYIDIVGDVYPCIIMNTKLGNVYNNTLKEILQSRKALEAREKIKKLNCPGCWLECESYRDIKKEWLILFKALVWGIKLSF